MVLRCLSLTASAIPSFRGRSPDQGLQLRQQRPCRAGLYRGGGLGQTPGWDEVCLLRVLACPSSRSGRGGDLAPISQRKDAISRAMVAMTTGVFLPAPGAIDQVGTIPTSCSSRRRRRAAASSIASSASWKTICSAGWANFCPASQRRWAWLQCVRLLKTRPCPAETTAAADVSCGNLRKPPRAPASPRLPRRNGTTTKMTRLRGRARRHRG